MTGLSSKLWSSLIGKVLFIAPSSFVLYIVGWGLGLIPQPVKDLVKRVADNATLLAFVFCFTLGSLVILKVYKTKSGAGQNGR